MKQVPSHAKPGVLNHWQIEIVQSPKKVQVGADLVLLVEHAKQVSDGLLDFLISVDEASLGVDTLLLS